MNPPAKSLARFSALLAAAAGLGAGFRAAHLPAAWLFGGLVVSALAAVRGWHAVRLPQPGYVGAQAVIGIALGGGFLSHTLGTLPRHLGIFSFAVLFILLASLLNGWLLARWAGIEPATALLGTMPGGAGAMAAMSDGLGADTAVVTAMQYTRLLVILASLALVGAVAGHPLHAAAPAASAWAGTGHPFTWGGFVLLAALALADWAAALRLPIPAAAFLLPCLAYPLLARGGIVPEAWPWPVLAAAYLLMGMQIGGRFHPSTVALIRRILPAVCGTTVLLLLASALLAAALAWEMKLPFLGAYLAATPGGLDSVAAVAADLRIDTTFILAIQLTRLLGVLLLGPWLVRGGVRLLKPQPQPEPERTLP